MLDEVITFDKIESIISCILLMSNSNQTFQRAIEYISHDAFIENPKRRHTPILLTLIGFLDY